jgi:hypothetical protein
MLDKILILLSKARREGDKVKVLYYKKRLYKYFKI